MTNEKVIKIIEKANISIPNINEGVLLYDYDSEFLNRFNSIVKEHQFYIDVDDTDAILIAFENVNELADFINELENSAKRITYKILVLSINLGNQNV